MTTATVVSFLLSGAAATTGAIAALAQSDAPQPWTPMALLGAVVLGIGGGMLVKQDKQGAAIQRLALAEAKSNAALQAMATETRTLAEETREMQRQIGELVAVLRK